MYSDIFQIGTVTLKNRLFIGTGKYGSDAILPDIIKNSETEVVTVALRRMDLAHNKENLISYFPNTIQLLPNTSGARNADEAIRIARIAKAAGYGDWIKIEVIADSRYLLPDGYGTAKATEILAQEGFTVLPYMNPDLYVARDLVNAGAAAIMPLGAPIGTNRGLKTKEMIQILIEEIDLPIIVDAGLGKPSHACEAMEMGASACLVNTAIATAEDPILMSKAFNEAIKAGRNAWLAKTGPVLTGKAAASSPLTGFLDNDN